MEIKETAWNMVNKLNPDIIQAIKDDSLVFFVGAGFSLEYGYPKWNDLVRSVLEKLKNFKESYGDYIPLLNHQNVDILNILDFIVEDESRIRDYIEQEFGFIESKRDKLKKHKKLFEITKKVVTTNYDRLLEEAAGKEVQTVVYTNKNRMSNLSGMNSYIFKLHGDFEDSANCVLFRKDYDYLYSNDQAAIQEIRNIVTSKCILFIGFSLTDPYIRELLKKLKGMYHNLKKPNYILTTSKDNFEEFGVQPFYFDNYAQIEDYLDQLIEEKKKYLSRTFAEDKTLHVFDNTEKDIGILQDIFGYILDNQRQHDFSHSSDDGDFVDIDEKFEINFLEEELELIKDLGRQSFVKFDLIQSIFSSLPPYQQKDVHSDIKLRFTRMKLNGKPTSEILMSLIDHYTPQSKNSNPAYTSIAQAIVFFFFTDCTWGKKTKKEEELIR